jgi:hypothetical protein
MPNGFISNGHNLIGKSDGSTDLTMVSMATLSAPAAPVNLQLGPLANNGARR